MKYYERLVLKIQRGFCQLDDVVTNTFGALAGWLMWKCATIYSETRFPKKKSKKLIERIKIEENGAGENTLSNHHIDC